PRSTLFPYTTLFRSGFGKAAQNVALDAEIVREDKETRPIESRLLRLAMFLRRLLFFSLPVPRSQFPAAFAPIIAAAATHRLDEIDSEEAGRRLRLLDELRRIL